MTTENMTGTVAPATSHFVIELGKGIKEGYRKGADHMQCTLDEAITAYNARHIEPGWKKRLVKIDEQGVFVTLLRASCK